MVIVFFATGYCWLIQQTSLNLLLWSFSVKLFFAPRLLHPLATAPSSLVTPHIRHWGSDLKTVVFRCRAHKASCTGCVCVFHVVRSSSPAAIRKSTDRVAPVDGRRRVSVYSSQPGQQCPTVGRQYRHSAYSAWSVQYTYCLLLLLLLQLQTGTHFLLTLETFSLSLSSFNRHLNSAWSVYLLPATCCYYYYYYHYRYRYHYDYYMLLLLSAYFSRNYSTLGPVTHRSSKERRSWGVGGHGPMKICRRVRVCFTP